MPLLHVRLSYKDAKLRTIGLVDSGSTTTFVPIELAEMLAIPVETQVQAVGAGGRFQNTIRKVNISILKGTTPIVTFPNFPAYVPTEADRIPYVVLGRDSIFRKYDVTFRERQQRVLLKSPSRNR
ncbi:MAG: aspartyl protease family protein [Candidatus Bathyarchaeia archaeon]